MNFDIGGRLVTRALAERPGENERAASVSTNRAPHQTGGLVYHEGKPSLHSKGVGKLKIGSSLSPVPQPESPSRKQMGTCTCQPWNWEGLCLNPHDCTHLCLRFCSKKYISENGCITKTDRYICAYAQTERHNLYRHTDKQVQLYLPTPVL